MDNKWIDYYYGQAFPDRDDLQKGGGFPSAVYRGPVLQRGYGIGNMFRSMARSVMPALKQGLKTFGKTALQTGLEVMQDVSNGENVKTAAKRRLKQNTLSLLDRTVSGMTARKTIKDKSKCRKPISSIKPRKRKHQEVTPSDDIFSQLGKQRK